MNETLVIRRTPARSRVLAASQPMHVRSSRSATSVLSRPATNRVHGLVRDANSSDLVNFPFAFTAFTLLLTGSLTVCWGMAVVSVWLTVLGFVLTLVGGGMCGWSLYDE